MNELRWTLAWESETRGSDTRASRGRWPCRSRPTPSSTGERAVGAFARPEVRIIGELGDHVVAHLGVLRRFLRVLDTGASVLVGEVGLVMVHPDFRGRGLGRRLLDEATDVLTAFDLPFGFLTCRRGIVPFYERCGWRATTSRSTMIDGDQRPGPDPAVVMVLPSPAEWPSWPDGHVVGPQRPEGVSVSPRPVSPPPRCVLPCARTKDCSS